MTEEEILKFDLSAKLLRLMQNEKIPFEKKTGTMDYLIKMGADVNAKVFGKTMAVWAKELGDERAIQYVKENNGKKEVISREEAESLGKQFWDEDGKIKSVNKIKDLVMKGANWGVKKEYYKQIWYDLSGDEINEVVKILPKGYVIDGDVDLKRKGLTELPDFSNVKVNGSFYCYENQLTSLRGAPSEVKESFMCHYNQLSSLEGAPRVVGRVFYCYKNQLTTLIGAPREVGQDFDCSVNQLTSLEGAPSEVGVSFFCSENQLTSLEGAPSKVKGDFYCKGSKLISLKGAPSKVGGDFFCYNNQLTSLRGAPKEVGGDFDCGENQLTSLEGAPSEVKGSFWCNKNQLISLKGKPEKIGGDFVIEDEVLARIKEAEKKKKGNDGALGFVSGKFEM